MTERQFKKLVKDVAILKANIYRKNYNANKYKQVSFRFDKNKFDYEKFKNKLEKENISISKFFLNAMENYLNN